jgi:hypothetical protein
MGFKFLLMMIYYTRLFSNTKSHQFLIPEATFLTITTKRYNLECHHHNMLKMINDIDFVERIRGTYAHAGMASIGPVYD